MPHKILYTQNVLIIFPWKHCENIPLKILSSSPWKCFSPPMFLTLEIAQPSTQFLSLTSGTPCWHLLPTSMFRSQWTTQYSPFCFLNIAKIDLLLFTFRAPTLFQTTIISHQCYRKSFQIDPCLSQIHSFLNLLLPCFKSFNVILLFLRKEIQNLCMVYKTFHDLPSFTASAFPDLSLNFVKLIKSFPLQGLGICYFLSLK